MSGRVLIFGVDIRIVFSRREGALLCTRRKLWLREDCFRSSVGKDV